MKKAYAKPVITFEDFAFSSNVAGECGGAPGIHAKGTCLAYGLSGSPTTCMFYDNGFTIFGDSCDFGPDDGNLGNLCYHVSSAANKIFKS
jgi:hypothetical protein